MAGQTEIEFPPLRRGAWRNRLHARLSALGRPASRLVFQPEPRSVGSFARGRQLCAGRFLFDGGAVEAPGLPILDVDSPGLRFEAARQGFGWLDDLAAAADGKARTVAQDWVLGWIDRFGRGGGPGWTPELAGRRTIRLIHHARFLEAGLDAARCDRLHLALARQTAFLARRWRNAPPGLARFEALAGLIYGALCLEGMGRHLPGAQAALERACDTEIADDGALSSRNPEELLEVLTLLGWVESAMAAAKRPAWQGHRAAIQRIAPVLRALRHADGGLARFHGGGHGTEGRLDQALAAAGVKPRPLRGLAMGYARLASGRTTVIVDAARPPSGPASAEAHASTLAFELTSGRRPVIVNCGAGGAFGPGWRLAGRASSSHSTLAIEGFSSSRLAPRRRGRPQLLAEIPGSVDWRAETGQGGHALTAWHDGYAATHGLIHVRQLNLAYDGRALSGEDTLAAFTPEERAAFERALERAGGAGIAFSIRFHLHPEIDAALDLGGSAVSLAPKSGEIWVFRHDGAASLSLVPSVYLETGRAEPRASQAILLSARMTDTACVVGWTLAKAHEGAQAPRDLEREDEFDDTAAPWTRPHSMTKD
ncbi:heparinase II/III family protein [Rhodovulum sulfidophilum]|uniref:heparinase II/III family protein n=1 Tax=Rhodovulum sulfidophilum TaxID=35806 RepID=UPI000951C9B9|nr:heparinase II/III family protein [Rhodovulum sulfidophilum]MBL3552099.1 heparinase II/III family protein [Rhodovulum sulfidophilum]OLS47254.1 heparinase [Rhodovulum sulfidophilum]